MFLIWMNKSLFLHSFYSPKDDCSPYKIDLEKGSYLFELWGASGGGNEFAGKGAYAAGFIKIYQQTTLYAFVGSKGEDPLLGGQVHTKGGCNGGGIGGMSGYTTLLSGGGGGGATDIRTSSSTDAYDERIIVAGGGGGSCGQHADHGYGGDAGIYRGYDSTGYKISSGGGKENCQKLGIGSDGRDGTNNVDNGGEGNGGGGGGYYGGCSSPDSGQETNSGGGGSSSYVSGYPNMKKHDEYEFSSIIIKDGKKSFSSPDGFRETGHVGDGFIRISYFPVLKTCISKKLSLSSIYLYIFCIVSKEWKT